MTPASSHSHQGSHCGVLNCAMVETVAKFVNPPTYCELGALTPNRVSSLLKMYGKLRSRNARVRWHQLVWQKDQIARYSFICWLVCKDRLRTKNKLYRWGVVEDDRCVLCGMNGEDRYHIFFMCPH